MKPFIKYALLGFAILVFPLIYPFEIIVGPDWTANVIDQDGKPLPGARVTEIWMQYSVESQSHEDEKTTDASGIVHFPSRTMRASLMSRFIGCFANFAQSGVHASCGIHTYLTEWKCGYGLVLEDYMKTKGTTWTGGDDHVKATIYLRACPVGHSGTECMTDEASGMKPCVDPQRN